MPLAEMETLAIPPYKHSRGDCDSLIENPSTKISQQTEAIATYIISYHIRQSVPHSKLQGLPKHFLVPPHQPSKLYTDLARVCLEVKQDNDRFFNTLPGNMNIQSNNAEMVFSSVCKSVFEDGKINWGRVYTILTLAATLGVYFTERGQLLIVPKIARWVRDVVDAELIDWITDQGGWEASCGVPPRSWTQMIAYGGFIAAAGYLLLRNGKLS